jgi:hypothetical protein
MPELVRPTVRVGAFTDLDAFEFAVNNVLTQSRAITIDCSGVRSLSYAAVRRLERASQRGAVTLSNAPPIVCLFAAVFGLPATPRTS